MLRTYCTLFAQMFVYTFFPRYFKRLITQVRGKQSTSLKQVADVPDYFILALFSLLIFIPTGLVAVVNSLKVGVSWTA